MKYRAFVTKEFSDTPNTEITYREAESRKEAIEQLKEEGYLVLSAVPVKE